MRYALSGVEYVMKQTILVADDETHIVKVIETKLASAGYRVHVASDGLTTLRMAERVRPNLVITDYQMPGMGGLELSAKIASHPILAGTPIILVTAKGFDLTETELRSRHIERVILKPFSPREVLAIATEILSMGVTA